MKLTYKVISLNEMRTVDSTTQTVGFEPVRTNNEPYPVGSGFSVTLAKADVGKFDIGQEVSFTLETPNV